MSNRRYLITGIVCILLGLALIANGATVNVRGPVYHAPPGGGGGGNWSNINWVNSTVSVTFAVTSGDLIVVVTSAASGDSTSSFHNCDNAAGGSNVYTQIMTLDSNRPTRQSVSWAKAKATETITVQPYTSSACSSLATGTTEMMVGGSFRNDAGNTYAVDATSAVSGSCSTTVTSTVDNVLLFGFGDASAPHSAGSGFTQLHEGANTVRLLTEFKAGTNSPGSQTVDKTCGTARSIGAVAFKIT